MYITLPPDQEDNMPIEHRVFMDVIRYYISHIAFLPHFGYNRGAKFRPTITRSIKKERLFISRTIGLR